MTNNAHKDVGQEHQATDASPESNGHSSQLTNIPDLLAKIAQRIAETEHDENEQVRDVGDASQSDGHGKALSAVREHLENLKVNSAETSAADGGQKSNLHDQLAGVEAVLAMLSEQAEEAKGAAKDVKSDPKAEHAVSSEETKQAAGQAGLQNRADVELESELSDEASVAASAEIDNGPGGAADTPWSHDVAEQLTAACEDAGLATARTREDLLIGDDVEPAEQDSFNYVYLPPDNREISHKWFERRFEELSCRFDKVTGLTGDQANGKASAEIDRLMKKFDDLEVRLQVLLGDNSGEGGTGGGALSDIEMCIAEIANQLDVTSEKLAGLDVIESKLNELSEAVAAQRSAPATATGEMFDIAALADLVAERVTTGSANFAVSNEGNQASNSAGIAELSSAMKDFMRERRNEGEHANAVLDTMQQTIIRVLDRMEMLEASGPRAGGGAMHNVMPAASTPVETQSKPISHQVNPSDAVRPEPLPQAHAQPSARDSAHSDASAKSDAPAAAKTRLQETSGGQGEEAVSLDRLQRAIGQLEDTVPAKQKATPNANASRSRADFIAAARQAAARANAPVVSLDDEVDAVEDERSRFASAARQAAAKATRRKLNDDEEEGEELEATHDGFSLGSAGARARSVVKSSSNRTRILVAVIALVAVGLGATKFMMARSGDAARQELQSKGMQQGSSLTSEKAKAIVKAEKVGDVAMPSAASADVAQKIGTDPHSQGAATQDGSLNGSRPDSLVQKTALSPQETAKDGSQSISGAPDGVSRQALPPAMVGPLSLRLAAANGDPSAEFQVASRFADGKGIKQDFDAAHKWYRRSAGRGFALAQYRLGTLYERGLGVAKDPLRARVWYERAAQSDNVKAMHNLAVLAASTASGKPDYDTAARWFKEAAERGLGDSQFNLAILYQNGLGVPMDEATAYKWFSLAAQGGDAEALKRKNELASKIGKNQASKVDKIVGGWLRKPTSKLANDPHFAGQAWQRSQS